MQNLIPIFQEEMEKDDILVPIVSRRKEGGFYPRYMAAYECTVEAIGDRVQTQKPEPGNSVDPFIFADTERVCQELIQDYQAKGHEVIVNITGGTKPMSIGAYRAALAEKVRAIYVDTENEQVINFYPDGRYKPVDFNENVAQIDVQTYLFAHGKCIDDERTSRQAFTVSDLETTRSLMAFKIKRVAAFMDSLTSAVGYVAHEFKRRRYFDVFLDDISHDDELLKTLEAKGYITRPAQGYIRIQKGKKWGYLGGRWLEVYVYLALKDSGLFHDVRSGIQLQGVRNDLDVVCVHNAKLAICECKAGDPGGQRTLNKLRTLKETVGGTFGRTFFVTTMEHSKLGSHFQDRAREYDITAIVDIGKLPCVATVIREKMREG
jgi:hypothetical protein